MSWSMHSSGTKALVLEEVQQYFNHRRLDYPELDGDEEKLRQAAAKLVLEAIAANPEDVQSISVHCDGSAYTAGSKQIANSIQISVSAVAKF